MKRQILVALTLLAVAASWLSAAEAFDPQKQAAQVAPFLDEQTVLVVRIDWSRIDTEAAKKQFVELMKPDEEQQQLMAIAQQGAKAVLARLKQAGAGPIYMLVNLDDDLLAGPVFVCPVKNSGKPEAVDELLRNIVKGFLRNQADSELMHHAVVLGNKSSLERLKKITPAANPALAKAFAAAGDVPVKAVILLSDDHRRVIRETAPALPPQLGGGSGKALADGFQWAVLGVDLPPKLALSLTIQSKDEHAARGLKGVVDSLLIELSKNPQVRQVAPVAGEMAVLLSPRAKGTQLVARIDQENGGVAKLLNVLQPPLEAAQSAAQRSQSSNHLKHIALAFHNYHDNYKHFPASSYDANGKPLLSWRVHILPYVDQLALYKQFHLDKPWDSEHNMKLSRTLPEVYINPRAKNLAAQGKTNYLAPTGEHTIYAKREKMRFRDITDGTSNTIMLLEANPKKAVIWTKPDDLPIDMKNPLKGVLGQTGNGFMAVFCDGSVRSIAYTIDIEVFKAYLSPAGGEVIPR